MCGAQGILLPVRDIFRMRDVVQVVRLTRHWIHYGFLMHTTLCILIAAFEGLLGR